MRGSAVLQSFTPRSRESSRLLNALTSAFRKHLDEVHPTTAEPVPLETNRQPRPGARSRLTAGLSSTVAADRHLASILTNPLVNKARGASVSQRLQTALNTSGADAIAVFEDFYAKQRLNLRQATQCLDHYLATLRDLSEDDQLLSIRRQTPGVRFLAWLCSDETHFDADLALQHRFHRALVYLLVAEGHERLLWEHLKFHRALFKDPKAPSNTAVLEQPLNSRWLVSLLCDMIAIKLYRAPRGMNRNERLDDAVQVCLDAFSLQPTHATARLSMLMPCWKIVSFSDRGDLAESHRIREICSVDPRIYRLWLNFVQKEADNHGGFYWRLVSLRACLNHPDYRDPAKALKLLDSLCDPSSGKSERIALFKAVEDLKFRRRWALYFADCALYLQEAGQVAEAARYFAKIKSYYPERKQELQLIQLGKTADVERDDLGENEAMSMGGVPYPGVT